MRILVLGNGFDIDHGLPTSYYNFLIFCDCVLRINKPSAECFDKLTAKQKEYIKALGESVILKKRFEEYLKDNCLLTYFLNRIDKQGHNWIDLEREIKSVINEFRAIEHELGLSTQTFYFVPLDHKLHDMFDTMGLDDREADTWDELSLIKMHDELCGAHERFTKALELYIAEFINNTPVMGVSPDVVEFEADYVLTFNYSDTYERVYGGIHWYETVDHIHGAAQTIEDENAHIILGVNSMEDWANRSYVEFEKYFQRITKKTDKEYTKWLEAKISKDDRFEIAFFGHSLDASDGDIIRSFICNEKSSVTIYYYDDLAYRRIVAGLVVILGKEDLVRYVSGENPKVRFVKQRIHEDDNTAGLEIARDIRNLRRMYSFSNEKIEKLIASIREKVTAQDIHYFYSQRKAISLFDVLRHSEVECISKDEIFDVCKMLPYELGSNGRVQRYFADEWSGFTSWGKEISCDIRVAELIKDINAMNQERFNKYEQEDLLVKISWIEEISEMKKALLDIFAETDPDAEYFKSLNSLAWRLRDNAIIKETFAHMKRNNYSLPIKVKIRYLEDQYDKILHALEVAKEMEESDHET